MAKDIFESGVAIDGIDRAFAAVHGADMTDSHFMRIAQHLYNAGCRKQSEGLWRVSGDMFKTYFCSECGYSVDLSHQKTRFCPECGAKMKGGAE
jgi:membrane protease subunit (stomatin/prohibitin family)